MPSLSEIVGQSRAIAQLAAGLRAARLHHAFLFDGPSGVGKALVARALAQVLNCERPVERTLAGAQLGDACGRCTPCRKIAEDIHPDLISLDMTPKGLTDRVRDLQGPLGFAPHEAKERVVIIDPAEELAGAQGRAEAANALLKTLEEPPTRTLFVLITSQARRLPVTVRSRCQTVRFAPLASEEIVKILVDRHAADPEAARQAAARSEGSVSVALSALEEGSAVEEQLRGVDAFLEAMASGDRLAILAAAEELGGERTEAIAAVRLAERRVRARIVERGEAEILDLAIYRALREASQALVGNVAPVLALEHAGLMVAALARPAAQGARR